MVHRSKESSRTTALMEIKEEVLRSRGASDKAGPRSNTVRALVHKTLGSRCSVPGTDNQTQPKTVVKSLP